MNVLVQRQGDNLALVTHGRIDGANATAFQDALENAMGEGNEPVVLDLENLTYISSAGLRVILLVARERQNKGAQFALCSLSGQVKEVFAVGGFDKFLPIHDTQEAAFSSFSQ